MVWLPTVPQHLPQSHYLVSLFKHSCMPWPQDLCTLWCRASKALPQIPVGFLCSSPRRNTCSVRPSLSGIAHAPPVLPPLTTFFFSSVIITIHHDIHSTCLSYLLPTSPPHPHSCSSENFCIFFPDASPSHRTGARFTEVNQFRCGPCLCRVKF